MADANQNNINLSGEGGIKTSTTQDGKDVKVAPGTATSVSKITTKTINNGKTSVLSATAKELTSGIQYCKSLFVGAFIYSGGVLRFLNNAPESSDIQVGVAGVPTYITVGGRRYAQFYCTFQGNGYNTALTKIIQVQQSYVIDATGTQTYKSADVLIGGSAPVDPADQLNGIVNANNDNFYTTCLETESAFIVIRALLVSGVADPTNDLTEIYGAGSFFEDKATTLGNMTARTPANASDSDFYNYGIVLQEKVAPTDYKCFNSFEALSNVNERARKDVKLWDTDYAGFNTDLTERHLSSFCITLKANTPQVTIPGAPPVVVPAQFTNIFKLELADGVKFGDIAGYVNGQFEASVSTDQTGIMSLTIGQAKQNSGSDGGQPPVTELLPLLDFTRVSCFVAVSFTNTKAPQQLLFFRDYQGSTARNLRFNIISDLTATEISALDNTKIQDITILMLKETQDTPSVLLQGLTRIGAGRYSFTITKSTVAGTQPTVSTIIPIDNNGACETLIPELVDFKTVADFTTAPYVIMNMILKGVATNNVIRIRDVSYNTTRKQACFGEVGIDGQEPTFISLGGDQDIRSCVLANETGQYVFFVEIFSQGNNVGADVLQACSTNDTAVNYILNGDLDLSTNDKLCDFFINPQVPFPQRSLPVTEASLQVKDANNEITQHEIGGGNNVSNQNGWDQLTPQEFYKSLVTLLRTNVNDFLWYTDSGSQQTYLTTTPATPNDDPTGFFQLSTFNTTDNTIVLSILQTGVNQGYFNTHQILVSVVSAGGFYPRALLDPDTIDIQNNRAIIRFFNTDGTPFDVTQIVAFSIVSVNISSTPITAQTLFSVGASIVNLQVTADQVNAPQIIETNGESGDGINITLDNTFTHVLYGNNVVTDSEAKYKVRFRVSGVKLPERAYLLLDPSVADDLQTNAQLQAKYWGQTLAPTDFMPLVETDLNTPNEIFMYALVSNISCRQSFILTKIKQFQYILPTDLVTPQRIDALVCRCEGLPTIAVGDFSVDVVTGNITNVNTFPIFARSYSINTAQVSGRDRLISSDIRTSDDNLGYKYYSTTIYRNNRLDGSTPQNNFIDRGMVIISLNIQSVDVLVSSSQYIDANGKKASASITGTGNKIIKLTTDPNAIIVRPVISAQIVLKPTAEIGTSSQIINSNVDALSSGSGKVDVVVDTDSANASTVTTGYYIISNVSSEYDALKRPTIVSKTGKTRYPRYKLQFTPSVDGVAPPTYSLTKILPTNDADYPVKIDLAPTIDGCLQVNADGTQTETNDLSASNTKFIVIKVVVTIDAGWDLPSGLLFVLNDLPLNLPTSVLGAMNFGTTNCATKNYPYIPDKDNWYISIKNLPQNDQQGASVDFTFVTFTPIGFYTNPDDNSTVTTQLPTINAFNGITKQIYGWATALTGSAYYGCTFNSLTSISMERSMLVNDTNGANVTAGHYLGTITRKSEEIIKVGENGTIIEEKETIDAPTLVNGTYKNVVRTKYTTDSVKNALEVIASEEKKLVKKVEQVKATRKALSDKFYDLLFVNGKEYNDLKAYFDSAQIEQSNKEKELAKQIKDLNEIKSRYTSVAQTMKKNNSVETHVSSYVQASYKHTVMLMLEQRSLLETVNRFYKPKQPINCKWKNESLKYALKRDAYFGEYGYAEQYAKSYELYADPFIKNYKDFKVTRPKKDKSEVTPIMECLKYLLYYLPRHSGMYVDYEGLYVQQSEEVKNFGMNAEQCYENEYMLYIIADKMHEENSFLARYVKDSRYHGNIAIFSLILDLILLVKNKGLNIVKLLNNTLDELTLKFFNIILNFDSFEDLINKYGYALPLDSYTTNVEENLLSEGRRAVNINLSDIHQNKALYVIIGDILKAGFKDIHNFGKGKTIKNIVDEVRDLAKEIYNDY